MNNEEIVKIYSIPGVSEVIDFRNQKKLKTACWTCHKRDCVCPK